VWRVYPPVSVADLPASGIIYFIIGHWIFNSVLPALSAVEGPLDIFRR
jgi:hypothetical protein